MITENLGSGWFSVISFQLFRAVRIHCGNSEEKRVRRVETRSECCHLIDSNAIYYLGSNHSVWQIHCSDGFAICAEPIVDDPCCHE